MERSYKDLPFLAERIDTGKTVKLTTNVRNKKNYVCHIVNLQEALKHGLKLVKIHNVLSFSQSKWMAPYIKKNAELRKVHSKNKFKSDFYKLKMNSVFGKTMENIKLRRNIKLVTTEKDFLKYTNKPNFVNKTFFAKDFCAAEMRQHQLYMNKPKIVGMVILELSKTVMYEFLYDVMKSTFKNFDVCYMDTDSFFFHIKTRFYKDLVPHIKRLDTSNYVDKNVPFEKGLRKKVIRLMKDETGDK